MRTSALAALLAVLVAASPASALEWLNLGPRALGMGGAGVAVPQGPLSSYWNPAGLGLEDSASGFTAPLGLHAALSGDVVEGANDLKEIADHPSSYAGNTGAVVAALNKINQPGSGVRVSAGFTPAVKVGRVGVFLHSESHLGASPFADFTVTNPANLTAQNNSRLTIRGIQTVELGAAYGRELPWVPGLLLGGAFKLMRGNVGYYDFFVARNDSDPGNILDKLRDGAKSSGNVGLDLGALWDMDRSFDVPLRPRLGLTGRNLNNPSFKQADAAVRAGETKDFTVNPQVRMGAALSPLDWWHLAADVDLTRNLTPLGGRPSQQLSLGTEIDVFNRPKLNVPLRFGILRNFADDSKTMLTLGSGLNLMHAHLEASLAWSPRSVNTQSQGKMEEIPAEVGAGFSLSVLFGGAPERSARAAKAPAPAPEKELSPETAEKVRANAEKAFDDLSAEEEKRAEPKKDDGKTTP